MKNSFQDLFDEKRKRPPKALIAGLATAVLLAVGLRVMQVKGDLTLFFRVDDDTLMLFYNTVLAVLISAIGTIIYSRYIEEHDKLVMDKIRSVIGEDLAADVLEDLSFYNGLVCEDWNARVELHPHVDKDDRFVCCITYNFRKRIPSGKVRIRFYRITGSTQSMRPPIAREALDKDFVWDNNESGFVRGVAESDYSVDYIAIDQQRVKVVKTVNSDVVDFEGQHESELGDGSHRIEFRVIFPIERESAMIVTHEWATRRATLEFDYTRVIREVTIWHRELTGIRASPLDHNTQNGYIKYINERWALPKSGYVFSWWKP